MKGWASQCRAICSRSEESQGTSCRSWSPAVSASPWRCSGDAQNVLYVLAKTYHYYVLFIIIFVQYRINPACITQAIRQGSGWHEDRRSLHDANKLLTRKRINSQMLFSSAATGMKRTSPSLWVGSLVLERQFLPNMPCASLQLSVVLPVRPTSRPKSSHQAQLWR